MSDDKRPLNNQHLMHLIGERAPLIKTREDADAKVRVLNAQILECLEGAGIKRHQLPNGTIVSIVQQKDRTVIVAERLLGHGVKPAIIADSTKSTPVAPFIRVDAPGAKGADDGVDAIPGPATEAPAPTPDPVH